MSSDHPNHPEPEPIELIDLEEYAKSNRPIPPGRRYQIRVDRERYVVHKPKVTGREILSLANKTPETHLLHQRLRGGVTRTIEADELVDLTGAGPERFMTMKRETQEGLTATRREFRLPMADEHFLSSNYLSWEAFIDAGHQWVVVHDFAVPAGYTSSSVSVAIQLSAGYPDAPLDMAFFNPHLQRLDGKPINALSMQPIGDASWQRWSRHRTQVNAWIPGDDNLSTHIAYVRFFLADEFRRNP